MSALVDDLDALVMDFALPASRSEMLAQAPLFAVSGAVTLLLYLGWYVPQLTASNVGKADASLQA